MKTSLKFITIAVLGAGLLVPRVPAKAMGESDGRVIFGEDFTLESGDSLQGDLIVLGGNVTISGDSMVLGSVVILGGQLLQGGTVSTDVVVVGGQVTEVGAVGGDVVVVGGQVQLSDHANVGGDVISVGGQVNRSRGAVVRGEVLEALPPPALPTPGRTDQPRTPGQLEDRNSTQPPNSSVGYLSKLAGILFRAVTMSALALILAIFLEPQLRRAGQSIARRPLLAGSLGLLASVSLPVAVLIMVITILLIPVAILSVLAMVLAWLFGMIGLGHEIGERLSQAVRADWAPVVSAGIGTFLLMIVMGALDQVPCLGPLTTFVIGLAAIGGALMTWFGRRDVRASPAAIPRQS